jgi:Zn-finger nucleic acid-binding protein
MSERQGIEIDYCPKCRGVWLDRGELDKLVERSGAPQLEPEYAHRKGEDHYQRGARRKRGFLGEIFDFD